MSVVNGSGAGLLRGSCAGLFEGSGAAAFDDSGANLFEGSDAALREGSWTSSFDFGRALVALRAASTRPSSSSSCTSMESSTGESRLGRLDGGPGEVKMEVRFRLVGPGLVGAGSRGGRSVAGVPAAGWRRRTGSWRGMELSSSLPLSSSARASAARRVVTMAAGRYDEAGSVLEAASSRQNGHVVGQIGGLEVPVLPASEWLARGPTSIDWSSRSPSMAPLREPIEMLQCGQSSVCQRELVGRQLEGTLSPQ